MRPVVNSQLSSICCKAKEEMKTMEPMEILGSWKNAITTADACWLTHTRGHFPQNATVFIQNYINNATLFYKHMSQRSYRNTASHPQFNIFVDSWPLHVQTS